jgi:hypothetical protein
MSLSANRREVIAGAGAAAVAAPLLRPAAASAKNGDLRVSTTAKAIYVSNSLLSMSRAFCFMYMMRLMHFLFACTFMTWISIKHSEDVANDLCFLSFLFSLEHTNK